MHTTCLSSPLVVPSKCGTTSPGETLKMRDPQRREIALARSSKGFSVLRRMYGSSSDAGAAFMVCNKDDDAGRERRSEACNY